MSDDDKPWGTHLPDKEPEFFGYERELALGQYIAEEARHRPMLACAFGYPGVGKTSFCNVIAWRLTQAGVDCPVLIVHCDDVASMQSPQARGCAEQIDQQMRDLRATGTLFIAVLDEIDCIAHPPEGESSDAPPGRGTVDSCAISLVRKIVDVPSPVFFIGATNYPESIEDSVGSRISWKIFFPPPTPEVIRAIIQHDLGLDDALALQTRDCYLAKCQDDGTVPMTRQLKTAIINLSPRICGPAELSNPAILADILYKLDPPPPGAKVRAWERKRKRWIADSEWQKDLAAGARSAGAAE